MFMIFESAVIRSWRLGLVDMNGCRAKQSLRAEKSWCMLNWVTIDVFKPVIMIKDDLQFTLTKYKCMAAPNMHRVRFSQYWFSKQIKLTAKLEPLHLYSIVFGPQTIQLQNWFAPFVYSFYLSTRITVRLSSLIITAMSCCNGFSGLLLLQILHYFFT